MATTKKAHSGRMTLPDQGVGRYELREARLAAIPVKKNDAGEEVPASADDLRAAVRMLLVCRTHKDREVAGYKLLHGMSDEAVGQRIDCTPKRVKEFFQSLLARAGAADANKHHIAK